MGNTPNIRFKGFTDDWEQRKLMEVAEYRNGKAHENEINDDGEYIVVNSKFVSTNGEIRKFSYAQNEPLYENEIAFVLSDVPNGRAIARTFLVDKSGKYTLNQRIAGITPHEDTDPYYLYIKMNRNEYFLKFDDGNKQTNLSIKDVLNYEDMYPSYKEQQKIGMYFQQLDHLITLHQRKYDKLVVIKKSMLEKMFPKNGQTKPEIRFSGFTDDWEQRKLGEIITEYKETVDSECTLPILTSSKTEGVILQEEHFGRKQQHDITGYNILPRNYCTYRNRSDGVDFTFNINKCCDKGIISKFYPVFSGKNSDVFFLSLVLNNSDEVVREIAYTCTGTGQKVLSFLDLQKMKVRVPSYDEQKKIAAYFENLDHLITLHQRKCDETKKLKKFMLQKMFPKKDAKKPEIRFAGFTNDWEQRKLGEIVERVTRKNQDLVSELPLTISAQYGLIDQNEFFDKRVASKDVSGYYLIYNGEFAYNKSTSSDAPWGAIKRLDRYENGVLSTLYIVFRIKNEDILNSD